MSPDIVRKAYELAELIAKQQPRGYTDDDIRRYHAAILKAVESKM